MIHVRNIKANDSLVGKIPIEMRREQVLVCDLHHEDDIGPFNKLGRDGIFGIVVEARR